MFKNLHFLQKSMLNLDECPFFYKKGVKDPYEMFSKGIKSTFRAGVLKRSNFL